MRHLEPVFYMHMSQFQKKMLDQVIVGLKKCIECEKNSCLLTSSAGALAPLSAPESKLKAPLWLVLTSLIGKKIQRLGTSAGTVENAVINQAIINILDELRLSYSLFEANRISPFYKALADSCIRCLLQQNEFFLEQLGVKKIELTRFLSQNSPAPVHEIATEHSMTLVSASGFKLNIDTHKPSWCLQEAEVLAVSTAATRYRLAKHPSAPLRDLWPTIQRFPNWCEIIGLSAPRCFEMWVGDAAFLNLKLEQYGECDLRFQDWFPPQGQNTHDKKAYHFTPHEGLLALSEKKVLLAGNSYFWLHDRMAHLLGAFAIGSRKQIWLRYQNRIDFYLHLRRMFNQQDVDVVQLALILDELAKVLYKFWDFATASCVAILAQEEFLAMPAGPMHFRGFALLAGQAPDTIAFSKKVFANQPAMVDDLRDFENTQAMAVFIKNQLLAKKVLPPRHNSEQMIKKISDLGEQYYLPALGFEQIRSEFLSLPLDESKLRVGKA